MHPAFQAVFAIGIALGGCLSYFWGANFILDRVIFPPHGRKAGRNITWANRIRPWLFLGPALAFLALYLAYPVFATFSLSLFDRDGAFVGTANYQQMWGEPKFRESLRNNMLWLIVVPAASTAFGLLAAQLSDRVFWGNLAKSLIFMPMAISFVGAAVIWKLIYDSREASLAQIGLLNAIWLQFDGGIGALMALRLLPAAVLLGLMALSVTLGWRILRGAFARGNAPSVARRICALICVLGLMALAIIFATWALRAITLPLPFGKPQVWLQIPFWNSFFLMAVLIWIQTGFAMVILSAALRGLPEETIEAAILDGANPFQIFFQIKIPQIRGTIIVVWTTITIVVLKVFDIVLAMTNGQWETQVLANYMYDKMFRAFDTGLGSAAAMVIMALVTPILIWNIWSAARENGR